MPRDRNKTLTCSAGAEPVAGARHAAVQRLQYFLSESTWDAEQINARRPELLLADAATAPHPGGVLVDSEVIVFGGPSWPYLAERFLRIISPMSPSRPSSGPPTRRR